MSDDEEKNKVVQLFPDSKDKDIKAMLELANAVDDLVHDAVAKGLSIKLITATLATRVGESIRATKLVTGEDVLKSTVNTIKDFSKQ